MSGARDEQAGFTLVEVMVALSVLAIATVGLIRATEAHIDLIGGLRARALAQWVAENRLTELELRTPDSDKTEVEMLGSRWNVETRTKATDDPDLSAVDILVRRPRDRGPLVTLSGFLDKGG